MDLQTNTTEKNCPRFEIAAYIDGELSSGEELNLEAHVAGCKGCLAELNLQKQMLSVLDFGLDDKAEIELPKDFAKVVAVRAESTVFGLRSKEERFRALFLCVFLFLIILIGLGAETENMFAAFAKFGEQMIAVVGFAGHLAFDLAVGTSIILRSLSGQFVFNSAVSFAIIACLFTVSAILLSRQIARYKQS
jgi:anti-sigma factor RsiW